MRLKIYQSSKGDCILLESRDGKKILCDGGMSSSMKNHVRKDLSRLRDRGEKLDHVYVSHVDQDHILGVLQLLKDELLWRVYDHHDRPGGRRVRRPRVPRPPKIGGIWHNAFRDQVDDNEGRITDLLAAAAPIYLSTNVDELIDAGDDIDNIATGVSDALKVSRLASPALLKIPINRIPGRRGPAKLLMWAAQSTTFPASAP